jgi:thiazole biosynthesis enzyme
VEGIVMTVIEEEKITSAIVERFFSDFRELLNLDVAVVGAGPSGLTAARYLAKSGVKVAVFERNLHVGGGMWGGGILFPKIVVQEEARGILEEVGVRLREAGGGFYTADSVEAVCKLAASALDAGARMMVGMSAEDVVVRENGRVCGVVLNWKAVQVSGMHVDPVAVRSRIVIDATGHEASVACGLQKKLPWAKFPTRTGKFVGEGPMWAEKGEEEILENTGEIWPGLVVAGMAASAVFGSPRMGAIFGGMLLSGRKAAEISLRLLGKI